MHVGCECNVVIATCPQRYLESTFLRCDNVAFTTLPQPKHNIVTTLLQRDFVCWVVRLTEVCGKVSSEEHGYKSVKTALLLSNVIDADHQYSCLFTNKGPFSSPLRVLIGLLAKFLYQ